ncbi:bacterial Ig-like domain-containing protein, partial [Ruminococcus sp.]|uniref:bacterial Ig-like domain-containing protein n=1 Tax=Ruminococcus sp. TaxID=41978 RepID=UPI002E80E632
MKRIISSILSVLMIISGFSVLGTTALAEETIENTIEIWNVDDLYNVRNNMSANYVLMADIDMSKEVADGGKYCFQGTNGWDPIGSKEDYSNTPFTGEFNGNNHSIKGLLISSNVISNNSFDRYFGLFANNAGTIKNLTLNSVQIKCVEGISSLGTGTKYTKYVGLISAYNSGTIENCHILDGNVDVLTFSNASTGYVYIGGITGVNNGSGSIIKCSNKSSICGTGRGFSFPINTYMGGIIGYNQGKISLSFNGGIIQNSSDNYKYSIYEGGIVGYSNSPKESVVDCYNCGDVYNTTGFYGTNYVTAIGNFSSNIMKNCYNVGIAKIGDTFQSFANTNGENIYSLKDKTISNEFDLTEQQMQDENSFTGFDFVNTWIIDDTSEYPYPQLRENIQCGSKKIDCIKLKKSPTKKQYKTSDIIEADGSITVYYIDGATEDIDITRDMLSGYNMSSVGDQTVTVTYRGKTLTYGINVVQRPDVAEISMVSAPAKTKFIRGTELDYTGAVAKVSYEDGTTENINLTPLNTTGANINREGKYKVTYICGTQDISFQIEVVAPIQIQGIDVKSLPNKTEYVVDQKIDKTGLEVYLNLSDGTNLKLDNYYLDYDNDVAGKKSVKVEYCNYIAYFYVEFVDKQVESISITKKPDKTIYPIGSDFDSTGMEVTAYYDNGTSAIIYDYEISKLPTNLGAGKVIVTYKGKSTTFDVTIKEKTLLKLSVTPPTKLTYLKGEQLDTTGMIVYGTYDNKKTEQINDYKLSGFGKNDEINIVSITCNSISTSFKVTIHNPTNKWVVTKNATCTASGKRLMYCTTCNDIIKQEEIEATGHNYVKVVVNPTCTKKGYTEYTCDECGDTYSDSFVDAIGHTQVIDCGKAPTCTDDGLTEGSHCKVCNTVLIKQQAIPKIGHSYTAQVLSVPSCSSRGSVKYTCQSCGDSYIVYQEALEHDFVLSKTIVEASCTTSGYQQYICSRCGDRYNKQIPKKEHQYVERKVIPSCIEKGYTEHTCKNCGDTYRDSYVKEIGHNPITDYGKPATCKENGLTDGSHCNVCDTVLVPQQIIPKLNHSYTAQVTSVPSCTTRGSVTYTCQSCGDSYVVYQEASNHNFKLIKTVNATCTTPGYKQYACTECNENYSEQIPITDHKPVVDKAVEATCVKTGLTEGSHCSECGAVIVPQELVKATGHSYTKKVVAPTCKDKGYTVYECTKCKDSYIDDYKDTVGHDYVTTVTTPATCKKTGVKTSTCSVCGDKFTTTIPMIDHKKVTDKAVAPTCTKTGLTEGSHCSVCGDVITEQKVVKPLDHDYVASVVEPTCTSKGYTLNTCTKCDDSYKSDYVDTVEHQYKSTVAKQPTCTEEGIKKYTCTVCGDTYNESIPKTEHKYSEKVVAPTCTENGVKKYTCTVCGDTYNESIPKIEHKYSEKVIASTCTTDGYTLHTCDLCGDSYKDTITQKVDHSYNSVVTKEPTCTEDGIKKYTCTVCGDTYSESISKTGHKYSEKVVAPTCTTDGYTLHTCDLCGDSYKDTITQKVDHSYNSVVTKEATCTEEGVKKYTCSTCGDTYTEKIPMTDHTVVIDKAVSATYTANGKTEGSHCSVCGKVIKPQRTIAKKKLAKPTGVKATAMSKSFKLNWKKVA